MKIMSIAPGSYGPDVIKEKQDYMQPLCSPGTVVNVVNIEGPACPTDAATVALMAPGILRRVQEAERAGYDAAVIACTLDPGLEAAKTVARIPVVGQGEATFHVACLLADKFGLITSDPEFVPMFWRRLRLYGVADRVTSIKTVEIPVREFARRKDELEARFVEMAEQHLGEQSELIVNACGAIFPVLGPGIGEKLSRRLGIAIVDPTATALRMAELLVNLGLTQSPMAFRSAG